MTTAVGRRSRRDFLKASAALGAGLVIPITAPAQLRTAGNGDASLGVFLRVASDGFVTVTVPVVEMGQGAQTALAMIIVDELGADWDRVRIENPHATPAFQRPDITKYQLTSGSWSVRLWYAPLRTAGAAAREMLTVAAAQRWNVAPASCEVDKGRVMHRPSQRSAGFGELAPAASRFVIPSKPVLRDAGKFSLTGKRIARHDIPPKVDGSAVFGIDVKVPGMVHAAIRHAPVYGAEVASVDRKPIAALPGVLDVVVVPGAVVVVADSFWHARTAAEKLEVRFTTTPHDNATTDALMADEHAKLASATGTKFRAVGDVESARTRAAKTVSVDYTVPFLHHAPMEPMNCTASVTANGCDLWVPTQCHTTALEAALRLTGLPESSIRVHATYLGGGFGRRIHTDFIEPAILASKAVKRPVKLVFTREEDMQHGFHRPAMSARMVGMLNAQGDLDGFTMRIVGPSVHEKFWPSFFKDGLDFAAVMAITTKNTAAGLHYAIPHQYIDYIYQPTHVPIGYWRAVGASHNGFFMEGFVDELAHAAGQDPVAYRRRLLKDSPRGLAVLNKAVEASGWGGKLPAGHGLGIAFAENVESIVAQVAQVSVHDNALRVHRVVAVIDCGLVINPDTVEAQMQGGIVNALSATLAEEITVKDGRCMQSNFHDYPILRMGAAPKVEVHIVQGGGTIGGVGEAMVPTLAPAVCNAIFAASGKRIRSLPIKHHGLTVA